MLIVSQDGIQLINIYNVTRIHIEDFSEDGDGFGIGADTNSAESQCWDLGYYKTEKRAREVLQAIINEYKKVLTTFNRRTGQQRFYDLPKIFYMPVE